jgi:SSS family solute:Na+ symporter
MYFKIAPKGWSNAAIFVDLPFMHQMGITFLITTTIMIVISLLQNKGVDDKKGIHFTSNLFKTDKTYNILSFGIILLLIALYSIFW